MVEIGADGRDGKRISNTASSAFTGSFKTLPSASVTPRYSMADSNQSSHQYMNGSVVVGGTAFMRNRASLNPSNLLNKLKIVERLVETDKKNEEPTSPHSPSLE